MTYQCVVVIDESLTAYDFGPQHPLSPQRVTATYATIRGNALLQPDNVLETLASEEISAAELAAIHTPEYIAAVKSVDDPAVATPVTFGIGSADVPRFVGMHAAAAKVCSASLTAARAVAQGTSQHAVNIAGGLHHAFAAKAAGFCVYNDIAAAINELLAAGFERIAYIDVDAHHGDGVESLYWDDARVMTMSIHESGNSLYPGTGFSYDVGGPSARGFAVNMPVPKATADAQWLRAFQGAFEELLKEFQPQVIVSQHGCDSHARDPLAHLNLSTDCLKFSYEMIHTWAHKFCDGKWVAVGGGGYSLFDVVPKAWSHLVAIATHQEGAITFTDGADPKFVPISRGWDPHDEIDRAILATRKAVYPLHGLIADPLASF